MIITEHTGADGTVRLTLAGELDLGTVQALSEQVEQTLTGHRPPGLVLDLTELTFCDSTGTGALIEARTAALDSGASFQVTNPHGVTELSLQIVGVHDLLTQPTPA